MGKKLCWICGTEIKESAVGSFKTAYSTVRLVEVNRPYSMNHESKPVYVCEKCTHDKIGMSNEGENLNHDREKGEF